MLDALCDLQYVLSGAVLEFGMQDRFVEAFNEVHRSNMSKGCSTEEIAKETQADYAKRGIETYIKKVGDLWVVYGSENHKAYKSIQYSHAELHQFTQ